MLQCQRKVKSSQETMTANRITTAVLKDVVAYVDVWSTSRSENYSDTFIQQLRDMGAQVSKKFSKQVTHVVFKNGHESTWNKAKKMNVKIVSVHWVARCKENAERADEGLYPAQHEDSKLNLLKKRTHRCMQPRDVPSDTSKRLKRKLDKMMESFDCSSPIVSNTSPFIIDEESGIVYSPSSRRADAMEQRLRQMRLQRENLSPTASQFLDSELEDSPRPSTGETPTNLSKQLEEEEEESLSETHRWSTSHEGDNENQALPSDKMTFSVKTTSKCHVKKAFRNSDVTLNSSDEPKVPALPKRPRRSSTKKQYSLDGYIHKTQSKKSISQPKPDDEATEKSPNLSCSSKGFKSCASLNSIESEISRISLRLKETKANSNLTNTGRHSLDATLSKYGTLAPAKDLATPHSVQRLTLKKKQAAVVTNTSNQFDTNDTSVEHDVFEDYFTSAKNTPGHRVISACSSTKAMHLPTFDLEPPNRSRRKSHSLETTGNRKDKTLYGADTSKASGQASGSDKVSKKVVPKTSEFVSKTSTVPEVFGFEEGKEERVGKRQRRRTEQNSVPHAESKDSKSTSDGLTDIFSEMCSKQGSLKTDKYLKKNRTLVMTSMPTEKQQTVLQVVSSLGGFTVVDTVCESTTHVVSGSPRRTLNVLLGIARGCWILSFEWILWSLEHRQWIPEEPYELSDHFPAAPICRLQQHLSAGEHQQDLFKDQPLMFVSPLSQPPCRSLAELIQLCGGSVCRSIRQAGLCIGEYKGKKPEGTKCLSEQWILDCVTHLLLLPHDSYFLEGSDHCL